MSEKKKKLSNRLIDGFLFLQLENWKTENEICKAVLERFGEEMCKSSELSDSGEPKYIHRIKKVLDLGLKNRIYEYNESDNSYRNKI